MLKKFFSAIILVIVNLGLIAAGIGGIEFYYRHIHKTEQRALGAIFGLQFAPYMMFSVGGKGPQNVVWRDIFTNTGIPAVHDRNNLGFRADDDFDIAANYQKKENERIVVITGGSAVHGVGATSSATNLSGVMESILNASQTRYRYRVINMGLGNAIAFQQFIILSLYGRWYDPDWIVSMDGWNDVAVACAHSQGAGYPMHYHAMRNYIDNYLSGQYQPSFYRGEWENLLIKYSAAYRTVTGKQYVANTQYTYTGEGFPRAAIPTTWADVERQEQFYLHAQELILGISNRAKFILSQQPMALAHDQLIADEERISEIERTMSGQACGSATFYNGGLTHFATRTEQGMQAMAAKYASSRPVIYSNLNDLLPPSHAERQGFLIDNMHLNDRGHRIAGTFYAGQILASDFPAQAAQYMSEMRNNIAQTLGQPMPDYAETRKRIDMSRRLDDARWANVIRVRQASYGMSCKNFAVPVGKNTVTEGNAAAAVAKACNTKTGCNFAIDARQLGDPANSCGKDFSVSWSCGSGQPDRTAYVPGEAHGKSIALNCQ